MEKAPHEKSPELIFMCNNNQYHPLLGDHYPNFKARNHLCEDNCSGG